MNIDEKTISKIANAMLKEFTEGLKDTEESSFRVSLISRLSCVTHYTEGKPTKTCFKFNGEIEFPYIEGAYDLYTFARSVQTKFMEKAQKKVKKGVLVIPNTKQKTESRGWSSTSYDVWNGVTVIRPCKEYSKLVKRFEALGLEKLDPLKWNITSVFGKRSTYSITDVFYHCTSSKTCNRVLEFLKGKKKATYEIKRHECMEDRERGEMYETEWSGSIRNTLLIKTADKTMEFGW